MTEPTIYVAEAQPGYWLATIPSVMGCNASGKTRDAAVANVRRAFRAYVELLDARGVRVEHWKGLDADRFVVGDWPPEGPFFAEDKMPLEEHHIRDFLHVFEVQQAALIALVSQLSVEDMERKPDADTWSVREALEHMMTTQIALLSRLEQWPKDPFNTLQAVHRIVFQRFTVMDPQETMAVKTVRGRPWTVRRVMRRVLEHEWEHYGHVQEIITALGRGPKG